MCRRQYCRIVKVKVHLLDLIICPKQPLYLFRPHTTTHNAHAKYKRVQGIDFYYTFRIEGDLSIVFSPKDFIQQGELPQYPYLEKILSHGLKKETIITFLGVQKHKPAFVW